MYSNNHEYLENIYHSKNSRQYENENKLIKKNSNYITLGIKRGTYDGSRTIEDYYTDHTYDFSKVNGNNSYIRNNNITGRVYEYPPHYISQVF